MTSFEITASKQTGADPEIHLGGGDFAFHSPSCLALPPPHELMQAVKIIEGRDRQLFISGLFISAFHHEEILAKQNYVGACCPLYPSGSAYETKGGKSNNSSGVTAGKEDSTNQAYYFLQELHIIFKHLLPRHHYIKA